MFHLMRVEGARGLDDEQRRQSGVENARNLQGEKKEGQAKRTILGDRTSVPSLSRWDASAHSSTLGSFPSVLPDPSFSLLARPPPLPPLPGVEGSGKGDGHGGWSKEGYIETSLRSHRPDP
jgi:hypothetical protein